MPLLELGHRENLHQTRTAEIPPRGRDTEQQTEGDQKKFGKEGFHVGIPTCNVVTGGIRPPDMPPSQKRPRPRPAGRNNQRRMMPVPEGS